MSAYLLTIPYTVSGSDSGDGSYRCGFCGLPTYGVGSAEPGSLVILVHHSAPLHFSGYSLVLTFSLPAGTDPAKLSGLKFSYSASRTITYCTLVLADASHSEWLPFGTHSIDLAGWDVGSMTLTMTAGESLLGWWGGSAPPHPWIDGPVQLFFELSGIQLQATVLDQALVIPHGVNCNAYDNGGPIDPLWPPGNGALLGDLDPMRNWCRANGISVALTQDSQRTAKDLLDELTTVANCAPVYSGNVLNFIPYDEVSAVGNGAVYRAPTASGPVAYLTDKDFVSDGRKAPVEMKRKRRTDCDNIVSIEHINRSLDYAHDVTSEPNQCSVAQFGPRKGGTFSAAELGVNLPSGSKSLLSIHSKEVAQKISSILAKRGAAGANVYTFTLKSEWFALEAMTLVAITDEAMGLSECPVRLVSVKENDDRTLACEAERFIYGLNHPEQLDSTIPTGTLIDLDVDPGLVDPPLIFEPPLTMTDNVRQLWIAVPSDDPAYGGCIAFMSVDGGATYNPIGSAGQATQGHLTADFATGSDPDTVNTLSVDVSESLASITSDTQEDADLFSNPYYVESASGFEVICPTVATLTGSYQYDLDTYIRRGAFGTAVAEHATGKKLVALDGALLRYDLDAALIGRVLKFKFAAYNHRGGQQNKLSDCVVYTYTPLGSTEDPTVTVWVDGAAASRDFTAFIDGADCGSVYPSTVS